MEIIDDVNGFNNEEVKAETAKTDYGRWKVNIAPPHISTPRFIAE